MNTIILPDQFNGADKNNASVTIHDYVHTEIKDKVKIKLTQNCFSFLRSGTKKLISPSAGTIVTANQFILLKSGNCLVSEHLSANSKYHATLFFFDNNILGELINNLKVKLPLKSKTENFKVFNYDKYLEGYVASLAALNNVRTPLKQQLLLHRLQELFLYLIDINKGSEFLSSLFTAANSQKSQIINVIENNLHKNLSIEELAFLCNLSTSTFKREFEKYFDESPKKWVQSKKLDYASYLIQYKKMRASDVYLKAGYESLSSFIQAYKRKFGITPKKHFLKE